MNEIINADELPPPKGFSHAIKAGDTVYLAGQIGDGDTLAEQFDDAAKNLITALKAAGGAPYDLVSLQIFTTAVAEYRTAQRELGEVWRTHFGRHYPAMGLFGVTELAVPHAKIELMGIAVIAR